jgi:GNAT superfamily N-acetyltransferase
MIRIRDAQVEDYSQLAVLLSQTQQQSISAEQLERISKLGLVVWRPRIAIQDDANIMGACLLRQSESDGLGRYNIHIDVHPEHQRHGIGSTLYKDALDFAQANGLLSLYAYVFENRPGGLDFAKKKGFVITRQAIHARLNVASFNEQAFVTYLSENESSGIQFSTLAHLGENLENRRLLYELNNICSADIPGRGPFFSFEEYCKWRFESPAYTPNGVIVARDDDKWVGMSAATYHQKGSFVFNEMTGVLPQYRRRGIAIALKLLVTRFARSVGAETIRTFNDSANKSILGVNHRMGYQPLRSSYTMEWTQELVEVSGQSK